MNHSVMGTTMPVLVIELNQGESVIAEHGELTWMTPNISMAPQKGQGIMGRLSRAFAGGGIGVTTYQSTSGTGTVAFAAKLPGRIVPIELGSTGPILVHRDGWICGTPDVSVSVGFQQNFGAGLFSGTGFILEKLEGNGLAWIELSGEIIEYDLAPGQQLLVHPAHVGAFSASVSCTLSRIHGIANIMFGKDGFFLANLSGPGHVWLQTMSIVQLAEVISQYTHTTSNAVAAGGAGGLLGGILSGGAV
jgi:uncharacterized protein (AIM24 family)